MCNFTENFSAWSFFSVLFHTVISKSIDFTKRNRTKKLRKFAFIIHLTNFSQKFSEINAYYTKLHSEMLSRNFFSDEFKFLHYFTLLHCKGKFQQFFTLWPPEYSNQIYEKSVFSYLSASSLVWYVNVTIWQSPFWLISMDPISLMIASRSSLFVSLGTLDNMTLNVVGPLKNNDGLKIILSREQVLVSSYLFLSDPTDISALIVLPWSSKPAMFHS